MSRRRGTSQHELDVMSSVGAAPFHGTIQRGRDSRIGGRDFHAQFAGTCGRCKERFEVGTVILRLASGYSHRVCPCDLTPEDAA